jgi:hypothetical protein
LFTIWADISGINMPQKYYMNGLDEVNGDEWYAKPAQTTFFSGHQHFLEGT